MTPELIGTILFGVALAALVTVSVLLVRAGVLGRREASSRRAERNGNGESAEAPEWLDTLNARVREAGFPVNPAAFLVLIVIVPCAAALAVFHAMAFSMALALLAFALTVYVMLGVVREVRRFRTVRFEEALVDAVDLLAGALKGGESIVQALESTAEASERRVRREFREMARRLQLGMPVPRAASAMLDRYDSESTRLFVNTLAAKWTAGGDLAAVLTTVSRMMRDRLRQRLHVRAQLAGAWVTAVLIAISPYVLVLVFGRLVPDWLPSLLAHPLGPALLFIAVCLQIVGFAWLHHIMRMDASS